MRVYHLLSALLRYFCRMFYTDPAVDVGYGGQESIHFSLWAYSSFALLHCGGVCLCSSFQGHDDRPGGCATGCVSFGNSRRNECGGRRRRHHYLNNAEGEAPLSTLQVFQATACAPLQVSFPTECIYRRRHRPLA